MAIDGILGLLIFLTVFGVLIRVPYLDNDVSGDHAVNSYRALGWFDSFVAGQVGPFDKLGHSTWWSELSFQDAPPVSFSIQRFFFTLFGASDGVARLPFILCSFLSAWLLYFYFSKHFSRKVALIGAGILLVTSYPAYASISGYIEGIENLFILMTLVFGVIFILSGRTKHLYFITMSLALALATKYTAIFLVPIVLIAIFLSRHVHREKILAYKHYLYAFFVAIAVLSPVIVYNLYLYNLTGHPDSALSSMIGITSDDFGPIRERGINLDIVSNLSSVVRIFFTASSFPLNVLSIISFVFLVFTSSRKRDPLSLYCVASVLSVLAMLAFIGEARFVLVTIPVSVMMITYAIYRASVDYRDRFPSITSKKVFFIVITIFFAYESLFAINSLSGIHWGIRSVTYAPQSSLDNKGYHELKRFIEQEVYSESYTMNDVETLGDLDYTTDEILGQHVLIYDDRIDWFSQLWYFLPYQLYYKLPVVSTSYIAGFGNKRADDNGALTIEKWLSLSGEDMFVVFGATSVHDPIRKEDLALQARTATLYEKVTRLGAEAIEIKDKSGETAFVVYRISKKP
jgi:4-amino-4-deoxy-L-arabinose transferase-like glycosyltransferase